MRNAHEAAALGMETVFQEPPVLPNSDVARDIVIGVIGDLARRDRKSKRLY